MLVSAKLTNLSLAMGSWARLMGYHWHHGNLSKFQIKRNVWMYMLKCVAKINLSCEVLGDFLKQVVEPGLVSK